MMSRWFAEKKKPQTTSPNITDRFGRKGLRCTKKKGVIGKKKTDPTKGMMIGQGVNLWRIACILYKEWQWRCSVAGTGNINADRDRYKCAEMTWNKVYIGQQRKVDRRQENKVCEAGDVYKNGLWGYEVKCCKWTTENALPSYMKRQFHRR